MTPIFEQASDFAQLIPVLLLVVVYQLGPVTGWVEIVVRAFVIIFLGFGELLAVMVVIVGPVPSPWDVMSALFWFMDTFYALILIVGAVTFTRRRRSHSATSSDAHTAGTVTSPEPPATPSTTLPPAKVSHIGGTVTSPEPAAMTVTTQPRRHRRAGRLPSRRGRSDGPLGPSGPASRE